MTSDVNENTRHILQSVVREAISLQHPNHRQDELQPQYKIIFIAMPSLLRLSFWIGALFYFAEAVLHFFGLPILEHNKIFLPTHDRYIAIMAITYGVLLILISTNIQNYQSLFMITMAGILAQGINAACITVAGGYRSYFPTQHLDRAISLMGYGFLLWYVVTWLSWFKARKVD